MKIPRAAFGRGFTLPEAVLASGITLIVGTVLIGILVNTGGIFYSQNARITEGLSLNDAVARIDGFVKQAAAVAVGYPEGTPTYLSGETVLVLKVPAVSESETMSNVHDFVVVARDSSKEKVLRLKIFPNPLSARSGEDIVLTTLLNSLRFTYLNKIGQTVPPAMATSVGVTLSVLSGTAGEGRSSSTVTTLRNAGS